LWWREKSRETEQKEGIMKRFITLITALIVVCTVLPAQTATADIYGSVLLEDGSAIPGVMVTLTGDVVGIKTAMTTEEGNYRFLKLPPGNYELRFELEGFKTVIEKNIRLYVGKNITLNVPMETTTIKEEIIVTQRPGAIDTRKTAIGVNVSKEALQALPTARNPWTVMNLIPGIMVDREDVGGAESGQQSAFYGHGSDADDATWNVDGANITDPSAIGAAPAYLNVNAYEELQVNLGANDITAQTGGVQLNFVSKRAGNRYSGDVHLYVEDEKWEMERKELPQYYIDNDWVSPGIFRLYQYGVNFGGPVVKDKWWWFGSWSIQDIHARTPVADEDATWLLSAYLKTNFQLGNTSADFHISHDMKAKWGRTVLSRAQQDEGSLFDQEGPGYVFFGQLQHVMGNLMLNGKVAYSNGGFILDPRGSDIDENGHNSGNDWQWIHVPRFWLGSLYHYETDRNTINLSLDANYFAENILGGDHEIRFGVDYYTGDTTSQTLYPNQRINFTYLQSDPAAFQAVWLFPDWVYDVTFNRISFYLSDTAQFGRLTMNLGIRFDEESGRLNETTYPGFTWHEPGSPHHGEVLFPDLLSEMRVEGGDSPMKYSVWSPRLSLSYDITGDGKNVVKASAARYGSQSGNNLTFRYWPYRSLYVYWYDDGDMVPQYEELADWYYYNGCRQIDYSTGWKRVETDPNFNSPILDELSLSFEKALGEDIAVSLSGFYKRRHNLVQAVGVMENGQLETEAGNWYLAGEHTFTDGSTAPYYERQENPPGLYFTNTSGDTYQAYMAAQIVFSKRFSNRWMLDASFTYSDWKQHWAEGDFSYIDIANAAPTATGDLTNFGYYNGGVVAPQSDGSGYQGIFVNSRWMFKFSGLYQLPWGVNLTAVFMAREGYVVPYHESVYRNEFGWTDIYKPDQKFGDYRLPSFWVLNLGIEKTFRVSDTATATLFINGYNITNNSTTLLVETDYEAENFDQPLRILNPGIFQFGFRVNF
jgi:hypothetical protein